MVTEREIREVAAERLGKDFVFRSGQLETIRDILDTFYEGHQQIFLLDAPTGSGKSVVALLVAEMINRARLKGYVLASDLSLFDQYNRDIERSFPHFGAIKGNDNYNCVVNDEKFSMGVCKLNNTSYEDAEQLDCFTSCGYLFGRKRAIAAPTSLLTYSYWLVQRCYVEPKMKSRGKGIPFPKRDFTICDEAHKVTDIVQNHFSPRIDRYTIDKLKRLDTFLRKYGFDVPSNFDKKRYQLEMLMSSNDQQRTFQLLKEAELIALDYAKAGEEIIEASKEQFTMGLMPVEWKSAMRDHELAKDLHCKLEDYTHIITETGLDYMVKTGTDETAIFNCLDESYMMDKYFHQQAGFKLLMTATMGNPKDFLRVIGGKDCRYRKMENSFDFTDSPVYFWPSHRMSYAEKEKNMDWMVKMVEKILEKHPESGIIHSGSYDLAKKIYAMLRADLRERIHLYGDSKEKGSKIADFHAKDGAVIMGPSLLEGLDLKDDISRFQIFVKVPYPSLGDKFVKAKMEHRKGWYSWKTITSILQGVGRSVRREEDWAKTYMLDGCFSDLLRRSRTSFPQEFLDRIVVVKDEDTELHVPSKVQKQI
jgi:Rad3-related DNA helicase